MCYADVTNRENGSIDNGLRQVAAFAPERRIPTLFPPRPSSAAYSQRDRCAVRAAHPLFSTGSVAVAPS